MSLQGGPGTVAWKVQRTHVVTTPSVEGAISHSYVFNIQHVPYIYIYIYMFILFSLYTSVIIIYCHCDLYV